MSMGRREFLGGALGAAALAAVACKANTYRPAGLVEAGDSFGNEVAAVLLDGQLVKLVLAANDVEGWVERVVEETDFRDGRRPVLRKERLRGVVQIVWKSEAASAYGDT